MRRIATAIGRTVALAVGLVFCGVGATVVMAQGAPGALQEIMAALKLIATNVSSVQTSVDAVQQSVNSLGAVDNFLFTPPVIVESGIIDCNHINVTSVDRHILTQLIDASTGEVVATAGAGAATRPGQFRAVGAVAPSGFSGTGYCKFTVTDGTKADIRANLTLTPNTLSDETTSVSVTAQ